jgi:hypothetical protein
VEVVEAGECVSKVGEVGEGFELKLLLDGLVVTGHKMAPELNNKGEAAIELLARVMSILLFNCCKLKQLSPRKSDPNLRKPSLIFSP